MTLVKAQRDRLLRRDADLARLVEALEKQEAIELAEALLSWSAARDAERRSLANEALERYRELNLLYDLAQRSTSLEPGIVIAVAIAELSRVVRRGSGMILVRDAAGRRVVAVDDDGAGFDIGEGVVGAVAAGGEGEIVNDLLADPRATPAEREAASAMMVAPLRAGQDVLGVMLVIADAASEFTAGEHRMLSAVAALTAPALAAALTYERTVARARAREAELQRQLDELRNEVEERRREKHVHEITSSDYFQTLRQQAEVLRRAVDTPIERAPAETPRDG